jgi:hypothetical protein
VTSDAVGSPHVSFFPYLPVEHQVLSLGEWQIGSVEHFEGRWYDSAFEQLARRFISSFRVGSNPVRSPAVVAHEIRGLDGSLPEPRQRLAIQRAVDFAYLDSNPNPSEENAGHIAVTTDNTELFIWPIDLREGRVTKTSGGVLRRTDGGYRINDDLTIEASSEVAIPALGPREPDSDLLASTYEMVDRADEMVDPHLARRVVVAIGWLSKAWRNTESIRPEDRIVLLKTGFEALTGKSDTVARAANLRVLFESALGSESPGDTSHLLWSPSEVPKPRGLTRHSGTLLHDLTDLEYWFVLFGRVRNEVIHDGTIPTLSRENGTNYDGLYFHIAERLLRESIRVAVGKLGYLDPWRSQDWRRRQHLIRLMASEIATAPDDEHR